MSTYRTKHALAGLAIMIPVLIAGCGRKGPLFLPEPERPPEEQAETELPLEQQPDPEPATEYRTAPDPEQNQVQ